MSDEDLLYTVVEAPSGAPVEVGSVLSAAEVAQLLEVDAQALITRSRMAARFWFQGFTFEITDVGDLPQ